MTPTQSISAADPDGGGFSPPRDARTERTLGSLPWGWILILGLLMVALFRFNLFRLWLKTNPFTGSPNWQHAIWVPLIGLYYLYIHRDDLLRARPEPLLGDQFSSQRMISGAGFVAMGSVSYWVGPLVFPGAAAPLEALGIGLGAWGAFALALDWGVGSLLYGILVFLYGIHPGQNDFVKDLGMLITLFGLVLMMAGWRVMRIVWFPIAFLACALPWPDLIYSKVAGPLQHLAAKVAVAVLQITGVSAHQSGTKITIAGFEGAVRTLNVAEACAGLRSLMTFISVAAAVAFLSPRPMWQRVVLVASAVPIAIFCNVVRVAGQGLLDHYVSPELSEDFAHQFVGLIMLVPAFFLIMLVGWILDRLFIEVVEDRGTSAAPAAASNQNLVLELPKTGAAFTKEAQ